MELSNVEKLLEKYFEGETTLSEEQELKVYFTREQVAPHLEQYKSMFQYFAKESTRKAPIDFVPTKTSKPFKMYKWVGVAASIIVAMGIFYQQFPVLSDGFKTEEEQKREAQYALQETKKALDMVSKYMNKGKNDLVYLGEFGNTTKKLIK
ncbi:hypothetical protein [Aquimarina rhabdastrellae]